MIEETDVLKYLIFKKEGEDGPDVKGGQIDALIIHATKTKKSSDGALLKQFFFKLKF